MKYFVLCLSLFAGVVPAEAGEPASLSDLLAEAEARNPAVLAARARADAAGRVAPRVAALPDPWLTLGISNESYDRYTVGESEMSNLSLTWSQEVPWPGKRPLMARMADEDAAAEELRARGVLLDVRARVKTAYYEIYRIDSTRAVLEESRVLLRGFEETTRSLYAAGKGMLENVLRAQTEITRLDADLARLDADREAGAALLNALVGRAPGEPVGRVTELPRLPLPAPRAALSALILQGSAEVQAMERMEAGAEAAVELARRERLPDLMWMGGYMQRAPLDPILEASVGFRIPAYGKRKQANAIAEAGDRREAARWDVEAARLDALTALQEEQSRFDRAERLLALYDEGILPQSRASLEAASAAYSTGTAEFNTLMDDFLAYLRYRVDRVAEEAAREVALARIEALVGGAR